ncbi:winged helix-turn-helix domain-containing protein [Brachybacterium kimchii]|uniref:Winged helix-turn-helix domain-containing protein n=1 Tax=Brachybacterium kimchii TaxID=2942909 RepID=A0ABY4N7D1_9MICO|nr:winged helix-turn-helix domain-containing protein [Brachybacterium kimchii]UQN29315.1 winged helix-turn-helix domain-containing protein [Brachybacterium kimchii]
MDRRLLTALDRDPGASIVELAGRLDVSERTVARRLHRMISADVVRILGRTLPGFGGRLARLVRVHGPTPALAHLAGDMATQDESRWVRLSRDGGELMCGFVVNADESADPLQAAAAESPRLQVQAHDLLEVWSGSADAVLAPARELEPVDHEILSALAHDGRMRSETLARRVGVDRSTASRRRRRLLEEGVLYLEADIHPAAVAESGDAMLWMRVAPGGIRELGRSLRSRPEVRFAAATSGPCTIVANVALPDRSDLVTFVDEQLAGHGVAHCEIVTMGRVLKRAG